MNSNYLDVALEAVKEAEQVILKYLDSGVRAELKEDQSPVTIADREAEETIKRVIRASFPDHTFYGEEGEKIDLENHKGYTWIIDPIDGTKSYLRHNPLFATQLALLHDGEFIIGVSNAPLLHEIIYAEKSKGCFFNGQPVRVSDISTIEDAYMSFGSLKYFTMHHNINQLLFLAENARWARGIGDFWSYHLLAQGKLDIMIEADTKLWDIAAMKVIIEEAGGTASQLDGSPVGHATTTFLATNGKLHQQIVDQFTS
jgi:histidinol-phosphatase